MEVHNEEQALKFDEDHPLEELYPVEKMVRCYKPHLPTDKSYFPPVMYGTLEDG